MANDEPAPGTILAGRYTLIREIGRGSHGIVWLADDMRFSARRVAVKSISGTKPSTAERLARLKSEADALSRLNSPYVVYAIDFLETAADSTWLVMEYVHGESLRHWLMEHGQTTDTRQIRELFEQITRGIGSAHSISSKDGGPIVHRDIKPDNILLVLDSEKASIKIVDFGIARVGNSISTLTGNAIGSEPYMAPEQALGQQQRICPATDVFSLGVLFIEMMSRLVTEPKTGRAWWQRVVADGVPSRDTLASLNRSVPPSVWGVISLALSQDTGARPSDANQLRDTIAGAWVEAPQGRFHRARRNAVRVLAHARRRIAWVISATTVVGLVALVLIARQTAISYNCTQISSITNGRSMIATDTAIYLLGGKANTLSSVALDNFEPVANKAPVPIRSFPTWACTRTGPNDPGSCGSFETSASMAIVDDNLILGIAFEPSQCNTCKWKLQDGSPSTCGSLWELGRTDSQPRQLSDEESYVSGIASDGNHLFWTRSYPQDCNPSEVRIYQEGSGAQKLYDIRPFSSDVPVGGGAEGGGIAIADGHLFWLSMGVRRPDGHGGLASAAPSEGILYRAEHAYANSSDEMSPTIVARKLDRPGLLTTDGHAVYFPTMDGHIYKYERDLRVLADYAAMDELPPTTIAEYNAGQFVVVASGGSLLTIPTDGGRAFKSETHLGRIRAIASARRGDFATIKVFAATDSGIFACSGLTSKRNWLGF